MMENIQESPINSFITEFGTRLNEVEEKQRLIKDRVLLIGENLILTKEELEKQNFEFKKQIKQMELDIKNLKQITQRIADEIGNLARKKELEVLERQAKIFQPLEFARIQDIRMIIQKEIIKINPS